MMNLIYFEMDLKSIPIVFSGHCPKKQYRFTLVHVHTNELTILYHFVALIDLSLKMYMPNIHDAGYLKEQTGKGCNKEERSYTHMHYGFILQSVYINFIDIFRNLVLNLTSPHMLMRYVLTSLRFFVFGVTRRQMKKRILKTCLQPFKHSLNGLAKR